MITLGEFKKFLAICGYPQAGGGTTAGKPSAVLAQSGAGVSHTGTTAETTLATITIPAGAMGVNGVLRIWTLWSVTNSANNKTSRVTFGGTSFMNATVTTVASQSGLTQIRNRNSASSQVGFSASVQAGVGTSANACVTSAVNTAIAQTVTITGQLASAGETITLEAYTVEVLNP